MLALAEDLRDAGQGVAAESVVRALLGDDPRNIRALRLAAALEKDKGADFAEAALGYLDLAVNAAAAAAMDAEAAVAEAILERARYKWVLGRDEEALADLTGVKTTLPHGTPGLKVIDRLEAVIKEFAK
jgi:hypothetical protein